MKIKNKLNCDGRLVDTEYDDETQQHTLPDGTIVYDQCHPIIENIDINNETWQIAIDPHTKRKCTARSKTSPASYKKFSNQKDYEDFLKNGF